MRARRVVRRVPSGRFHLARLSPNLFRDGFVLNARSRDEIIRAPAGHRSHVRPEFRAPPLQHASIPPVHDALRSDLNAIFFYAPFPATLQSVR